MTYLEMKNATLTLVIALVDLVTKQTYEFNSLVCESAKMNEYITLQKDLLAFNLSSGAYRMKLNDTYTDVVLEDIFDKIDWEIVVQNLNHRKTMLTDSIQSQFARNNQYLVNLKSIAETGFAAS